MMFRLQSGHQMTECKVCCAKLCKPKVTVIWKIASEEDVKFFDVEGVIQREFVPEGQKVNAEFYVGVLERRTGTLLLSTTHLTRQILHLPTTFSSQS